MKPDTPLQSVRISISTCEGLLAYFLRTGTLPANLEDRAVQTWIHKATHNAKATIAFCDYHIRGYLHEGKAKDEMYWTLCDAKRKAMVFLRTAGSQRSFNKLNKFNIFERLQIKYDSLSGEVGHIFILMAPDLAARAEGAL